MSRRPRMKPQSVRILAAVVAVQLVVLALVLWVRRDTDDVLAAFEGTDGYLVVTMLDTEIGPNPYFASVEREVVGGAGGQPSLRSDPSFGEFGAYGDTLPTTCDPASLSRFLTEVNPNRGAIWAGAQMIGTSEIGSFVAGLRLSVLSDYTLVTGHQLDPSAIDLAEEVVLEPGTAVLIDDNGDPRVRCLSGAPITAARDIGSREA